MVRRNKFYSCDIETLDGLKGCKFAIGCIYPYFNQVLKFDDVNEFCKFILDRPYPEHKFYFHNLSFDIRFILEYCLINKIPIPSPIIRGSNYISQTLPSYQKGRCVKIYDSYSLIPIKLDDFTKVFNLKTQKTKVDFDNTNINELYERCKNDVVLLYEGLEKFFNIFPLSKRCSTLPSVCIKEFTSMENRYQFTTKRYGQNVEIAEYEELARLGYFGGRCEVYDFNYYDKVYCYDINSLYPFVMQNNLYPISISHIPNKSVINFPLYYVKAVVSLPYYYIPPLPIKTEKLIFGIGKLSGWFYSPEFEVIKDMCDSYEILDGYAFEGDYIFKNFVTKYWNMRKKLISENNPLEKLVKLYLNSLYGKFGQKRKNKGYSYVFDIEEGVEEISDGVYIKEEISYSKSRKINPFISGFVTSYARKYLWENLNKNDKNSLYTDTDSIFSLKQINNVGTDLGQFKLVGIGEFKPVCCKTYFFKTNKGYEHKAKGVYKNNIPKSDSYDEFVEKITKTDMEIFAKTRESIRRFGHFLAVKSIEKSLSLNYDKRVINADLTTSPRVIE